MPRDERSFLLFSATVEIRASVTMTDADLGKVSDELDELNDLLDDTARTFLDMRKSKWRSYKLKLSVR